MKRVVSEDRVIYVERHRLLSLLCFCLATVTLALGVHFMIRGKRAYDRLPMSAQRAHRDDFLFPGAPLLVVGAGALYMALHFQFASRAFIILGPKSSMILLERQLLSLARQSEYPLAAVAVRMSTVPVKDLFGSHVGYWIWLEISGRGPIPFQKDIRDQWRCRDAVAQLNEDLRTPTASELPTE